MGGKPGRSGRKPKSETKNPLDGVRSGLVAPSGIPECPSWLGDIGRLYWQETIEELSAVSGLLSRIDRDVLAAYCVAWEDFHDARIEVESEGGTAISSKGLPYQHPAVGRKNEALKRALVLAKEFGMTPLARTKLPRLDNVPEENAFEQWLRDGKN